MNRLNRLVELETVLMDSRKANITENKIEKVSAYIERECAREKAVSSGCFRDLNNILSTSCNTVAPKLHVLFLVLSFLLFQVLFFF